MSIGSDKIQCEFYVCPVCFLFLNWNSESKLNDIVGTFVSEKSRTNSTSSCAICLGILQRELSDRVVEEINEKFGSTRFDVDSFNLAISLPPSCLVREKVASLVAKKSKGDDTDQPAFAICLKDACRLCYQAALEKIFSSDKITFDSQSDFTVGITFENGKADECCNLLYRCFPDQFPSSTANRRRHRKHNKLTDGNNSEWSRSAIMDVLPLLTTKMMDEFHIVAPLRDSVADCSFSTNFVRAPLFIGGRYCKYSRYLTQTPWMVDGIRRGNSSVQELICEQLVKVIGSEDVKFSSSGREDTDVRMLNNGRPFVVNFVNPRRKRTLQQADIDDLQRRVNSFTKDVQVDALRAVTPQEFNTLKVGEEHKKKTYVALIWSPVSLTDESAKKRVMDLNSMAPIELDQKTPIRVLHRRPLAVRKRTVEDFRVIHLTEHYFQLRLTTQAGTYVKEFVHGDFGRTRPSLSDLLGGIPVDILELDVESIDLNWP